MKVVIIDILSGSVKVQDLVIHGNSMSNSFVILTLLESKFQQHISTRQCPGNQSHLLRVTCSAFTPQSSPPVTIRTPQRWERLFRRLFLVVFPKVCGIFLNISKSFIKILFHIWIFTKSYQDLFPHGLQILVMMWDLLYKQECLIKFTLEKSGLQWDLKSVNMYPFSELMD